MCSPPPFLQKNKFNLAPRPALPRGSWQMKIVFWTNSFEVLSKKPTFEDKYRGRESYKFRTCLGNRATLTSVHGSDQTQVERKFKLPLTYMDLYTFGQGM